MCVWNESNWGWSGFFSVVCALMAIKVWVLGMDPFSVLLLISLVVGGWLVALFANV